jgi:hypothetical protein
MVSVHGGRWIVSKSVSPLAVDINQITGSIVSAEESCIPRLRRILVRLFGQVLVEFAVALEGLHKILALR